MIRFESLVVKEFPVKGFTLDIKYGVLNEKSFNDTDYDRCLQSDTRYV